MDELDVESTELTDILAFDTGHKEEFETLLVDEEENYQRDVKSLLKLFVDIITPSQDGGRPWSLVEVNQAMIAWSFKSHSNDLIYVLSFKRKRIFSFEWRKCLKPCDHFSIFLVPDEGDSSR